MLQDEIEETLQQLLNSFAKVSEMAIAILDNPDSDKELQKKAKTYLQGGIER